MGWTERREIKNNYQDIVEYLDSMDGFHDYRIGDVEYKGDSANIMIEEVLPGRKIQDDTGLIWDFHFEKISKFIFSVDCVVGFWISEVERGNAPREILFNLNNGIISVVAEKITLGITSLENI